MKEMWPELEELSHLWLLLELLSGQASFYETGYWLFSFPHLICFRSFRASVAGGALSMTFLQFRTNRYEISNATFVENTSQSGGAIAAEYYVYAEDQRDVRIYFNDPVTHPSIQIFDSLLTQNSATKEGGAFYLNSVRALLDNVTMHDNNASEIGGACSFTGGSAVLFVNGQLYRNKATLGGALSVGERCMLHCVRCEITRNEASDGGGGVAVAHFLLMRQPIAFQCDGCSMTRNRARLGGEITTPMSWFCERLSCRRSVFECPD